MTLKKNIIANYIGQFYTIVIGIVMVPFYLQYLGAEAYGLVGFFALMQSWMLLLDMGLSPTLSREVAKLKSVHNADLQSKFIELFRSLETIFIVFSIIMAFTIVIGSDWIANDWLKTQSLESSTVSYSISLMGIMIGLRFLGSLYRSGISGAEAQVWLNGANTIISTFRFVGVLVILHFISSDVQHFFEYQLVIAILEFVILSIKFYNLLNIEKFKLYFSYHAVKPILPFAFGIAYTAGIWIFLTQLDKLLLSNILTLKEFGYFALVAIVANAILQLTNPIGQALQPRMIALLHQGKESEMLLLYRKSTQFMAIFIFAVVGIVGVFSYELLYAWTGNKDASLWAKDILFWYVMGNGVLAMSGFQYALQFTHGNLKLHVQYNTVIAILSIPLIIWSAYSYGAIGVAVLWFIIRAVGFLVWIPIVHYKFARGIHKNWLFQDILPVFISSLLYLFLVDNIRLSFEGSRLEIFMTLIFLGLGMLVINSLISGEGRKMIVKKLGIDK